MNARRGRIKPLRSRATQGRRTIKTSKPMPAASALARSVARARCGKRLNRQPAPIERMGHPHSFTEASCRLRRYLPRPSRDRAPRRAGAARPASDGTGDDLPPRQHNSDARAPVFPKPKTEQNRLSLARIVLRVARRCSWAREPTNASEGFLSRGTLERAGYDLGFRLPTVGLLGVTRYYLGWRFLLLSSREPR